MKTILVPIDFSPACNNALNYAVAFAKKGGLSLHLLNVDDEPLISEEPVMLIPSSDQLITERLKRLKSIRAKIHKLHGENLKVEVHCEPGEVIETIHFYAREYQADLIIMGMHGGGYLAEKILGSTTTSLMRKCVCPVLGIGMHMTFKPIEHIVLTTDYKDNTYTAGLKPLRQVVQLFNAHLSVLYVIEPTSTGITEDVNTALLSRALDGISYSTHIEVAEDFVSGVKHFISENAMDLAAILPKNRSFFFKLFNEPNTKQLAFHTDVPLLALQL